MVMKAIRIAALSAALLVGGALMATAHAQQGGRRGVQLNGIELTDAQKSKYEEIQRKYQPEMQSLIEQRRTGGDPAVVLRKGMELREKSGAEIRAILTPAQQAVFDRNIAQMKKDWEERQRQTPPGF
jgi:Spy/CpxP family protein refolding chaperone